MSELKLESTAEGIERVAMGAERALYRLAHTKMDLSLQEWGDVCNAIQAAINASRVAILAMDRRAASPVPAVANLSIEDLTLLSRVWNDSRPQPHGPDYRVNEWLKAHLAEARVHGAIAKKAATRGRTLTAEEKLTNLAAALASDQAEGTT